MRNKKYTHLFFDLDNTLWDFNKNSYLAMQEAFSVYIKPGNQLDFEKFFKTYSHYNQLLWKDYRNQLVSKKDLIRVRFQKTFDELNIDNADAEEMNFIYLDEMPKQLNLIQDALPVLNYLKSKGYQLNIISNGFSEVQYKKLENTGLSAFFYKVFLSGEIKTPKPGMKIFDHAIKSTNARKKSSLMIGDDWEVDICGAMNFGIDAVYLNQEQIGVKKIHFNEKNVISVYRVDTLSQLRCLL